MTLEPQKRQLVDFRADGNFSSIHKLLLDLELDHIIPDELHLMLRISDVLIKALIDTARTYDRHCKTLLPDFHISPAI